MHLGQKHVRAALLGLSWLLLAPFAEAEPKTRPIEDAVTIEGDTKCLVSAELSTRIAKWLKIGAIDHRVSIVVTANDNPAPSLSFVVLRENVSIAVRKFDPPPATCDDTRAAVSIAIALAVEATVLAAPVPEEPPPALPTPVKEPPPSEPAPAKQESDSKLGVAADIVGLANVLPKLTLGAELRFEWDFTHAFALEAIAMGTLDRDAAVGTGAANTRLLAGGLGACWIPTRKSLDLRWCAGMAGGGILTRGDGFSPSLSPLLPWVAATSRVGLRVPLWSSLAFDAGLRTFVPVVRPRLDVAAPTGSTVIFSRSLPIVGAGAEIGLVVSF